MRHWLASELPDTPCWIDTRGVLLAGRGKVFASAGNGFLVASADFPFVGVVGAPDRATILRAVRAAGQGVELLVQQESRQHCGQVLPDWEVEATWVHTLPAGTELPAFRDPAIRFLRPIDLDHLEHLPTELRDELRVALAISPVAAWFEQGRAVSFCYAGVQTESWWDVSVDTLEGWRGRGLAGRCFTAMHHLMLTRGKRAVWGAHASNHASLAAAVRLGFERVGSFWTFRPPGRVED